MTLIEFYDLLARHDWSYQYSDDHRHWTKGRDESDVIQRIVKNNNDNPQFRSLYEDYRSWFWDQNGDVVKPGKPI